MTVPKSLDDFLEKNKVAKSTWERADVAWELLRAIADDHDRQRPDLTRAAGMFASALQEIDQVHSVRWRVKDTAHLLKKIIRRRADRNPKYLDISVENYYERVTDLIGLRALHLFKDECFPISDAIAWSKAETPIAYIRAGDGRAHLEEKGFVIEEHEAGYRSIHYVCSAIPMQRKTLFEIQVRTIFEEGWSEIDHRIRYPDFSDEPLISYFLGIFNRMAGSADEMGTFVRRLETEIDKLRNAEAEARNQAEKALATLEATAKELAALKGKHTLKAEELRPLQSEVSELLRLAVQSHVQRIDYEKVMKNVMNNVVWGDIVWPDGDGFRDQLLVFRKKDQGKPES